MSFDSLSIVYKFVLELKCALKIAKHYKIMILDWIITIIYFYVK